MAKRYYERRRNTQNYGFWRFTWDLFMTIMTGGIWFVWILYRHLRNNSN